MGARSAGTHAQPPPVSVDQSGELPALPPLHSFSNCCADRAELSKSQRLRRRGVEDAVNDCAAAGSPRLDSDNREEVGGVRGQAEAGEDAPELGLQHDGPAQHKGEEQSQQEQVQGEGGGENILPDWGE